MKQRRDCRNVSKKKEKHIELILPDRKKNSKLAGFESERRTKFKGPHQCSLALVDASIRQPSAPTKHNLAFHGAEEGRKILFADMQISHRL